MAILILHNDEKVNNFFIKNIKTTTSEIRDLDIISCDDFASAFEKIKNEKIDLIITDLDLESFDGFNLMLSLWESRSFIPIFLLTTGKSSSLNKSQFKPSHITCFTKPVFMDEFTSEIIRVLGEKNVEHKENINIYYLLRIAETEMMNCKICVKKEKKRGFIFVYEGEVVGSFTQDLNNMDSISELSSWQGISIKIEPNSIKTKNEINIKTSDLIARINKDSKDFTDQIKKIEKKIESIEGIKDFQVFDLNDQPKLETNGLDKIKPSSFIEPCEHISHSIDLGNIKYIQIDISNNRYLIHTLKNLSITALLDNSTKPEKYLKELYSVKKN